MVKLPVKKKKILFILFGIALLFFIVIYTYLCIINYNFTLYKKGSTEEVLVTLQVRKPINPIIKFFGEFSAGIKTGTVNKEEKLDDVATISKTVYTYPNLKDYYGMSDRKSDYYVIEDTFEECSAFSEDCPEKVHFEAVDKNLGLADFNVFIENQFEDAIEEFSWNNWNYNTHYVYADILELDAKKFQFKLKIIKPAIKDSPQFSEPLVVDVYCPSFGSAIVYDYNYQVLKRDINVFDELKVGEDRIFTYCRNKECTEIGNACIIERKLP